MDAGEKAKGRRNTTSWKSTAMVLKVDLEVARKRIIDLEMDNLNLRVDLDAANRRADAVTANRAALAKELLLRSMQEIAGRYFGIPVFIGVGQALWSEATSREPVILTKHEAVLLRKLSAWSGGWWTLNPGDSEMRFVDSDQWSKEYENAVGKSGEHTT